MSSRNWDFILFGKLHFCITADVVKCLVAELNWTGNKSQADMAAFGTGSIVRRNSNTSGQLGDRSGQKIKDYTFKEPVGRGTFGNVYKAHDKVFVAVILIYMYTFIII